jgi:haloalkane dehalogenase
MDTAIIDQIERPEWLDTTIYPFTLRTLDTGSGPITYVDEGEGPTILLVHAGMWSFIFRDVIARLRSDFRCVTLDFPGSGLSEDTDSPATLAHLTATLVDFVRELDLRDITLVAHDLGGLVSLGAAGADPDRYRGIVMANTFGWTPHRTSLRMMLRLMGGAMMTGLDVATNFLPRLTATNFGVGRHLDEAERSAFLGPFRDRAPRRRFHHLMRDVLADPELTAGVEVATQTSLAGLPVLSIYGEKNDMFGFQKKVAETWADHEGIVIEKGNHFPMCDDPDLVVDTLRSWHERKVAVTS